MNDTPVSCGGALWVLLVAASLRVVAEREAAG